MRDKYELRKTKLGAEHHRSSVRTSPRSTHRRLNNTDFQEFCLNTVYLSDNKSFIH